MKTKKPLACLLATIALPLIATIAPAATIEVLQTYDFPGVGNNTLPQKISDQGVIINTVVKADGTVAGFFYKPRILRFSDASFSDPNDTGRYTQGRGINNDRHSCGEYLRASDGTLHGYIFEHPSFFDFDVTGAVSTIPLGLNNGGEFVGTTIFSDGTQLAFINLSGVVTTFSVPNATATLAYQLNKGRQSIGYYVDSNGVTHGFTRDKRGTLSYPIDMPGATGTILFGNNDLNYGVGRYTDAAGLTHGLFYLTPDNLMTYDYPGSTYTSLNGINSGGYISGYYLDASGIAHGIWAKLNVNAASTPNSYVPMTPVKPAWLDQLSAEMPAL